jgi:hypothetical protein
VSWGTAATRRCDVLALARRVKDLTWESRIASFGGFLARTVSDEKERRASNVNVG